MSEKHSIRPYLLVFGALLVLTVVTVAVSYVHLQRGPAIALGLLIAALKASLVAAFFMHLRGEKRLIYYVLGLTVFFMLVLFTLPTWDSRDLAPLTQPADAAGAGHGAAEGH